MHVQYGCGTWAPEEWLSFDSSTTLRLQRIPFIGGWLRRKFDTAFPSCVRIGDIVDGLPGVAAGTCDGIYCSHVLEHLCLADFRTALENTFRYLRRGGIFRCVVPDLGAHIDRYLADRESGDRRACTQFMRNTSLGWQKRPRSIVDLLRFRLTNSYHLWMWDAESLMDEMSQVGFRSVRECEFNDAEDPMFLLVENKVRFKGAVALEAEK